MYNFKCNILFFFLFVFFAGCEKDTFEYIDNNEAPPDETIEHVIIENYIIKLYISVLGRQPTEEEFNEGLMIIESNDLSINNRGKLVDVVMANEEYLYNEYKHVRSDLLNGADTADFTFWIKVYENIKTSSSDERQIDFLTAEIEKLEDCQKIIPDLESDSIDFSEVQRRCCFNTIYDGINMGTENFVVSMYQNFLFRYPTIDELESASRMVDQYESIVFFELGRSKRGFLSIFLSSDEYYEGQIRRIYNRFLFREPNTAELNDLRILFTKNKDYKEMQKQILIQDEYVGIQ